jgi:hypothetical protein
MILWVKGNHTWDALERIPGEGVILTVLVHPTRVVCKASATPIVIDP